MISALQDVFTQYQKKVMPASDYQIMNAGWVSQNVHEYKPTYYEPMSARTSAYCDTRMSGHRDYDAAEAKSLGVWFARITFARQENEHNKSLVSWAIQTLEQVQISGALTKLNVALKLFNQMRFDHESYHKALKTKELDAFARIKGGKNS